MRRTLEVLPLVCLCALLGCSEEEPVVVTWERAPDWIQASPMSEPRSNAAAVVLADGRLLIAGGYAGGKELKSAEIFDARFNTWQSIAPMASPRLYAAAVLLRDGRALLAGGSANLSDEDGQAQTPEYLASAEIYDPQDDTWTSTPPMNRRHTAATATLLANGQVLVVGGRGGKEKDIAERFDPEKNAWSLAGQTHWAHHAHTATLLSGGSVLIAGGYDSFTPLKVVESYDPEADRFDLLPPMALARQRHVAVLLDDGLHAGQVVVAGGLSKAGLPVANAEAFDPETKSWSLMPSMLEARGVAGLTIMPGGDVIVAGGLGGDGHQPPQSFAPIPTVEAYVPGEDLWKSLPPLHEARQSATVIHRGNLVFVAGGNDSDSYPIASVEVYMHYQPCSSAADCFAGYRCSPEGVCGIEMER